MSATPPVIKVKNPPLGSSAPDEEGPLLVRCRSKDEFVWVSIVAEEQSLYCHRVEALTFHPHLPNLVIHKLWAALDYHEGLIKYRERSFSSVDRLGRDKWSH